MFNLDMTIAVDWALKIHSLSHSVTQSVTDSLTRSLINPNLQTHHFDLEVKGKHVYISFLPTHQVRPFYHYL